MLSPNAFILAENRPWGNRAGRKTGNRRLPKKQLFFPVDRSFLACLIRQFPPYGQNRMIFGGSSR
jgi:hypothetical protein